MNYKPDEATLISYLYGELEGVELEKVEQYLQSHPEEKKRIQEWTFAKSTVSQLADKEVIAPPIILGDNAQRPFWKENYFRISLGMAASFLLLLVAARLLDLSVAYSDGELRIGFGRDVRRDQLTPGLTEQKVGEMIQAHMEENNTMLQASWSQDRKSLEESIEKNLKSSSRKIDKLVQTASNASQEQVRAFVGQIQTQNLKLVKDYMQLSATGQREYIEGLLVDFSKYLQEQRNQDMEQFQTRLTAMEQDRDQFQQETGQILTSLMTSTATPNNSVKRN